MARIKTYTVDTTLNPEDKWIGTDGASGVDNGKTKNFTVQAVSDYVLSQVEETPPVEPTYEEVSYTVGGGTEGDQPEFDGDPLFSGSYIQIGKLIHFQIQVDMDNITSFGTGQYYITLPKPPKYPYMFRCGCLHDDSNGREYHISGHVESGSDKMFLYTSDTQGNTLYDFPFTSVEPITLDTKDNFHIAGSYITE